MEMGPGHRAGAEKEKKMETFAEKLRRIRTEAGWKRPKMVERVGVPVRTIEDWEAGKMTPPEYVQKLVIDRLLLEIERDTNKGATE